MSYESTYSSKVNTRLVRQSGTNISDGVISLIGSIRGSAQDGIRMMDSFMNRNIEFPCSVVELKTELKNNIKHTVNENPKLSVSQCYMKTILNHSITEKIVENVPSFKSYTKSQNLTGREAFKIGEQVMNECITEIEKTFVDVKTILTVQAVTACGWQIIDSNSEKTSQTIIAQNNEGTVLAVQIKPEKMLLDVSGLNDSSCKMHVKKVMAELSKLGIETKVDNEIEHRRKRGGTLLSFGESASTVNKVSKIKESLKKKKNLSFQASNDSKTNGSTSNHQQEIQRERE